jgi:hypothetical protein
MTIIGITGNKGHGKDTVADILYRNNPKFKKLSFAGHLKKASSILLNEPLNYFYDEKLKESVMPRWGFTPRWFLQKLGTDFLRNKIEKDIFIKNMKYNLEKTNEPVVVTDIRFDNEAKIILDKGGIIVKVDSSERLGKCDDKHETEDGIDSSLIDIVVYNNLDYEKLESEVIRLIKQFKNKNNL